MFHKLFKQEAAKYQNVNCYMRTFIEKDYGWFDASVAFFTNATSFSIAANYTSGQYGENVIKTLLQFGANPTLKSTYSIRWIQPPGILTDEQFFEETPDKSAIDKNIKYILLLAIHQFQVKRNAPNSEIVSSLNEAIKMKMKK